MSKLLLIDLGPGNLNEGFPMVTVQFWKSREKMFTQYKGHLPAQPNLIQLYREWKLLYNALHQRLDWGSRMKVVGANVTNVSQASFDKLCLQLRDVFNCWLNTEMFERVSQSLGNELADDDEVQVIIETEDQLLRRIPWHQWEFFDRYQHAELALSAPQWDDTYPSKSPPGMVRILAIFGNAEGINLEKERQVLEALPGANVVFLKEPRLAELAKCLEDAQGWSLLFFAGHSHSEAETGWIQLNREQTISIDCIESSITQAIQNGLQIAIFNSCDGLGIAQQIEALNIPHVIVMRERVIDLAAQAFLNRFLLLFANEVSFFVAVRQARQRLSTLEDTYPYVSWLPVICQNPSARVPTWKDLRFKRPDFGICPYKGLEFFDCNEEDPKFFFGREKLVGRILEHVRYSNFLALVGASGNGKSSVLRAGLIYQLKQGHVIEGSDQWQIKIIRPDRHPIHNLAKAFVDEDLSEVEQAKHLDGIYKLLLKGRIGLLRLLQDIAAMRLILIIDQFEEVFTRCDNDAECEHFIAILMEALDMPDNILCLVIAMRSDFIIKCHEKHYNGLARRIDEGLISMLAMESDELKSAIIKPAERVGLAIDNALVTEMLDDIQGSPGSLPLLQYTLKALWQERKDNQLNLSTYQSWGGIRGTLDKRATEIYKGFDKAEQLTVQHIFQQLTQLGLGTQDTRRRMCQKDLITEPKHPAWRVQSIIEKLSSPENRLLVTSQDGSQLSLPNSRAMVDVAHEVLIRHWQLLRKWIIHNRESLLKQRKIEESAIFWREQGQHQGDLLQGKSLKDAEEFAQHQADTFALSDTAKIFIVKSLKQRLWNRVSACTWVIVPTLVISGFVESNLRQEEVNDLRTILDQGGTYAKKHAAEKLVKGCKSHKEWSPQLPIYLSERIFGHCQSLKGVFLGKNDFSHVDLSDADLGGAKLSNIDLRNAKLTNTSFRYANLINANLLKTYLNYANLNFANLSNANLKFADLSSANLSNANLFSSNLSHTNLINANLFNADLRLAKLNNSVFSDTDLHYINLKNANLSKAIFLATDLRLTQNLTEEQFTGANPPLLCNSPLPIEISVDMNRDCASVAKALLLRDTFLDLSLEKVQKYVNSWRKVRWQLRPQVSRQPPPKNWPLKDVARTKRLFPEKEIYVGDFQILVEPNNADNELSVKE